GLSPTDRVLALVDVLDDRGAEGHTTNLCVSDAEGRAVVLTSSLGLGSGDFLPGLDLHLNSMLGEKDLLVGALEPGARMQSMMAPSLALDADGPAMAIGSAGGTVRRWPDLHHYFGGTSLLSRRGPAADPRRDGLALEL